jgi:glycerophosphoryl diester phosphodiesterase
MRVLTLTLCTRIGKFNLLDDEINSYQKIYDKYKAAIENGNNKKNIIDKLLKEYEGDNMKKIWILSLLVLSLLLVACGGNTTESTTNSTETTTAGTNPTTVTIEQTTLAPTTTVPTTEAPTTQAPTTTEQTTTESEEPVELSVSASKPYIFTNINEEKLLSDYVYRSVDGSMTLADGTISNVSEGLTISAGNLTALSVGMHTFDFTYGDESFVVYVFSKNAEDSDYLVYSMSYTDLPDGPIPDDYIVETLGTGSTGIKNGYLYVDSPDIADPTRVLLPEYLKGFKNYIIEVDFSILTAVEETRWASVMYRFSTANYFQMAIRQAATATNGVEFAKAINGQWNVPLTTAYKENIDPSKIYRLRIDLFGAVAKEYINDELLIEYKNARDYSTGYIGVQSSGARAIYNNFEIRIPETYIDYTNIEYQNVPTVYTPETDIIMAPTVIQTVQSQDDIDQLQMDVRGSTALFDINPSLSAINSSSEVLLEFRDILELVKGKTIPAFRTSLPFVAQNLAVNLGDLGVRDVFLISSNGAAIERARSQYELIRGVYQINYDPEKPILSDEDLLLIKNETNMHEAVAVLLPVEYATKYNVDYLQRLLVTVWVDTSGKDNPDIYQAIVSGAQGMVNDDALNVYDIFDTFPENSLMRLPLIIGHRGMPSAAPENTVEGSWLAYQAGADVIELDIYLTTDNEIVVMHDTTTERTTDGNLTVENSTLAELRELTIIDNFGTFPNIPLPTLEEYFIRFKGEKIVLFIEIKSTNANIVPALRTLIEEYDFFDQSVVITFHTAQALYMREYLPEVSVGLLNSGLLNAENVSSSLAATINQVVPIKTTLNPYYVPVTKDILLQMQHRGITIWPWTINNPDHFIDQITLGVGGITTDHSDWISDEIIEFYVPNTEFTYSISNPTTVELMGRFGNRSGFDYPFLFQFEIISGAETGITFGTRNSITGATSVGDVYVLPYLETTLSDGTILRLYYDIVHVQITE